MDEFQTRTTGDRRDRNRLAARDDLGESLSGDRTYLVTGGAGFIGSHLAARLAVDGDVRVLDDLSTGSRHAVPETATLIEDDVTDREAVARAAEGVDVIFHLAAVVSVEESVANPFETNRTNVDGTLAVLDAAREVGARVVLASSAAVYGHPESLPVTVDEPQDPQSPYGASKAAADAYARAYEASYDVPVVALRYFNVYGRGQRGPYSGVIDAFLERALDGEPLVVHGDGEQTRDFVHVSDVVRANVAAATTDDTGTAYNVGTGRSVTINELGSLVRTLVETDVDVRHDPPRPGDVRHSRAATTRTEDRLEFRARVGLEEGLADLISARAGRADGQLDSPR
ncbi:NAD-dependent epimerase/dehydratase family protein [Halorubrum sp. AD140]|uniref:NAD-dependent epimerase/dehydratase family protein n=1 Tax=Halorubrum sp. AD140 TaxID=3050073 RepID=UPI002ACEE408|nr:NAD-dependent epimerase/dehydratase family protein [Halorubrum sp. AD140]